jgi:hypothetical protein
MKNIGLFKKIRLFRLFKKIVNENKNELNTNFGIRVDRAYRLYTILNIPEELIGDAFSLRKSDIDRISEPYIKEYTNELGSFLNSKGLSEMYDFYELSKEDKLSWKLIIGFKLFKSNEYYNKIYYRLLPISLLFAFILSLLLYFI